MGTAPTAIAPGSPPRNLADPRGSTLSAARPSVFDVPVRLLAASYVCIGVVGAVLSLRRRRPARFLGVRLPGPPVAQALTIGTPLSAPPAMLVALAWAASRRRDDVALILAMMFLIGIVGEPDTYRAIRRPAANPVTSVCVALDAVLPAAIAARAMKRLASVRLDVEV